MKNLANYFNPNVTDLEIFVTVGMGTAEDTGWEFSDLYEASRERDEEGDVVESYDDARQRLRADASICVKIEGDKESPRVSYVVITTWKGNREAGDTQDTGDDEQSIKDCIEWLESNVTESVRDYSFETAGNTYRPAFAQFETLKTIG